MANLFINMMNNAGDWLAGKIAPHINDALGVQGSILSRYYMGDHRKQLKVKAGAQDENIIINFVGLAVDRSVSRLFRGGIQFQLPEGAEEQQEYLDNVWDLNKKEILLYQVALHGAVYGTPYFKISPDAIIDPYTEKPYPRLIAIDPEIVRIKVSPQDMNEIEEYKIEYTCLEHRNGREVDVSHRELIRHADNEVEDEAGVRYTEQSETWQIEEYEQVGGGQWQLVMLTEWPYNFPPIIHWKNLPSLKTVYGDSDIDDAINVQDKSNFVVSNTGKIIKFHAHPETIGTGFSVKDMQNLEAAVGSFHAIPNPDAKVFNLEMQSDLASSRAFALDLRQSIFDISREVDISSMADKLGQLTNFGLQVLWSDAIDKNNTKRQLFGDALLELNRRLLVLAGFEGEESRPGTIQWSNPLPVNIMEEMTADEKAISMAIVDKETVANRYFERYGKSYDDIKAAIAKQKTEDNQGNSNIGAMILRNFSQGQGANNQPANQQDNQGQ
jgi:hypothetical protein